MAIHTSARKNHFWLRLALLLAVALHDMAVLGFTLALGLVGWAAGAQFVRTEVRRIRATPYIESARALGERTRGVLVRHVLRGLGPQLFGLLSLEAGSTLLLLAELGFLGVFMSGGAFLVVKPGIASAAALAGKVVATPQLGNTQDVALRAWLDPSQAVVPEGELFPPGQSVRQTEQQDTAQMSGSQQTAQAAALTKLHIPYQTKVSVVQTVPGTPAAKVLKPGDVITAVDGITVTGESKLTSLITGHPAGSVLHLSVLRAGKTIPVAIKTVESGGRPIIGVTVQQSFSFPFTVKINVGDIGGARAGVMFALGILDQLTKDNLSGGKFIAGTGEITPSGKVLPIGGIQQKMVGARDAGATVFLAPAANCSSVVGAVPAGLRIVKVSTLSQAMTYLQDIKAGKPVPSC